ncbi:homeobox-leucine zipper protein HOX11-like [Cornus florida]|uniref:homeobox-leucine zipper protein HOX11-like n=1 Tax=Cornus florida TaxID=4283 RepID=UPI00289E999B|nr:homeobox-leucine zipper protein HOX11-like [Cornus florida]
MELGLTLGHASKPFGFFPKDQEINTTTNVLAFPLALGIISNGGKQQQQQHHENDEDDDESEIRSTRNISHEQRVSIELDLLPLAPVPRHAWPPPSDTGSSEGGSSGNTGFPAIAMAEEVAAPTSPNSGASSFQMDYCIYRGGGNISGNKRDAEGIVVGNDVVEVERASSRASDDDENGLSRKKLRLSKQQSAYLEESFKEHNTLNPKQKLALAKQLNLRPRQVEVWFQNRRARTKLKQTEVDCEYLKRCCETLTEENRRLNKEVQELRALKTSNPFYMQLPATTLTMCPSCERVATTTSASTTAPPATTTTSNPTAFSLSRPRFYPYSHSTQNNPHQSAAS